jgi:DNA repair protein RadC
MNIYADDATGLESDRGSTPALHRITAGPRERISEGCLTRLSDAELVQAILGTGVRGHSVASLARRVVGLLDGMADPPDPGRFSSLRGIGQARACAMAAALELGRRRYRPYEGRIASPADFFKHVAHYADRKQERFICASLNGAHEAIAVRVVSLGLVNRTLIHPREVFSDAIQDRAAAVILAHNHPTGRLEPSQEDRDITERLTEAGRTLGISVLDHIIFSRQGFFSFREENPAIFKEA